MSMDRRTVLTALVGACVAASAIGVTAASAAPVPRVVPAKPREEAETPELAQAGPAVEGEARLEPSQFIVVRRRRRWWRPWRRRWRVYFY